MTNPKRTAQIALGKAGDDEFLNLKNYKLYPERADFGWASNNSVVITNDISKEDRYKIYSDLKDRIIDNGEPGIFWIDNAKEKGRTIDPVNNKDHKIMGTNPCGEQSLESSEVCNLSEVYISNNDTLDEYLDSLRVAYLYGKTVSLGDIHWEETDTIVKRNRRLGISNSGIADFITKHGLEELKIWLDTGYKYLVELDKQTSAQWKIPESIKLTSIKPSGSISILPGVSSGMHYPIRDTFIRRVRIQNNNPLVPRLRDAGYTVEEDLVYPSSFVVEFPTQTRRANGKRIPLQSEVSIEQQMELAALLQNYWADNQVSCTISFDKDTEGHKIPALLAQYESSMKAISFLPNQTNGVSSYKQMPFEEIDEEAYANMISKLRPVDTRNIKDKIEEETDKFCGGEKCTLEN